MNKIFTFIIICICFIGCDENGEQLLYPHRIRVDLQNGYASDSVIVKIDNDIIINNTITTNPILSFASSGNIIKPDGRRMLHIENISDSVKTDTSFFHTQKDIYIGISYSRIEKRFSFIIQNTPFNYR